MREGTSRRVQGFLVAFVVAAAVLGAASLASGANGDLRYRDCITGEAETAGSGACAPADITGPGGADSGLDRLRAEAVSSDGESLYTISVYDDAVALFDRDPTTGQLTYRGCITGETQSGPGGSRACAQIASASSGGAESGLDSLRSVVLSPDGEWLYAASSEDDAVASFDRDPTTGQLTYAGCITGERETGSACASIGSATSAGTNSGLNDLRSLAMSPDGKSLYAAANNDDSVASFDRDPTTGRLTYTGCITGKEQSGPDGSNACAKIGSATTGGVDSGLDSLVSMAMSPDGESVYTASELDDSVASFDRDPTSGRLTYAGCITGERETDPACATIGSATSGGAGSGINELHSVAVSPDGGSLYTASQFDDAVARFDRDSTGALTYRSCITGDSQYGPSGSNACAAIPTAATGGANSGLDTLRAVTTSPDGKSLYAASATDDGVASFDRDASGALAYRKCTSGETESGAACTLIPSATSAGSNSGLSSPRSLVVSPAGNSLYAGARDDDGVAHFDREVGNTGPDTTPPDTRIQSGPNGPTNDSTPTFSFTGFDDISPTTNLRYSYKVDDGQWSNYSAETSATLGGTSGLSAGSHTFYVKAKDEAGNEDPTPAQQTVVVDTVAPTGTVSINDGASRTRTRSVTLTLQASDPSPATGVTHMRISNTASGLAAAVWEAYATTRSWTLTSGRGTKTVYVQYKDAAANVSAVAQDTITYRP